MIYSAACSYAIRAMCRMTMINPVGNVLIDEICADTELPKQYVAKVLQNLVRSGLLKSTKGRGGGFALTRRPEEIYLFDIVMGVDGEMQYKECAVGLTNCNSDQPCPLHDKWAPVRDRIGQLLRDTTLQEMSLSMERKLKEHPPGSDD